ncbi:hypothetical protein BRQ86_13970 [Salmonella enterica]|nr:hypothetical protein [Salmonella enterica]
MNAIRSRLKHLNGERLSFTAKISKFGMKSSFKGMPVKTILLVDRTSGSICAETYGLGSGRVATIPANNWRYKNEDL